MILDEIEILEATERVEATQDTLTENGLKNPCLVFEKTLQDIQDVFIRLEARYDTSFEDLVQFLQEQKPTLAARIDRYQDQIDNDVYGRFREGRLTSKQYQSWEKKLEKWKSAIIAAVRNFELSRFGEIPENSLLAN